MVSGLCPAIGLRFQALAPWVLALLWIVASGGESFGQPMVRLSDQQQPADAGSALVDEPAASRSGEAGPDPVQSPSGRMTPALIEGQLAQLQQQADLPEELRGQLEEFYRKAIDRLAEADRLASLTQGLRDESAGAADEMRHLAELVETPPDSTLSAQQIGALSGEQLRATNQRAEVSFTKQRQRLQAIDAEVQRRNVRLRELPELLAGARAKLEDAEQQLAMSAAGGEPPALSEARRARLRAVLQTRQAEVEWLSQELSTYSDSTRLMALRRDLAERQVKSAQRELALLQQAVAERDKLEASQRAAEAHATAASVHPAVRGAAKVNSQLADENSRIVTALKEIRRDRERADALRDELRTQYQATRQLAKEMNFSQAVGMMLRAQQAELPDTEYYRARARQRSQQQSDLGFKLLQWENERRKQQSIEEVVDRYLNEVNSPLGLIERVDVRGELLQVVTARAKLFSELIRNARDKQHQLAQIDLAERGVVDEIEQQARFISQHILWVRSTAPLSHSLLSPMATALDDIVSLRTWKQVGEHLQNDARSYPIFELLLLPPLWLLITRRRLHDRLERMARQAQVVSSGGIAPTIQALALTSGLAIPVPALMTWFGWRLTSTATVGGFPYALGAALMICAGALAAINFLRHACRAGGLAEAHFGWSEEVTTRVRHVLAFTKAICLPASFICLLAEYQGDELLTSTVGRLALIVELLALATVVYELLRSSSPLGRCLISADDHSWTRQSYRLGVAVLAVTPVVIAFLSAIGYHYTATRLATRMAATWGVITLLVVARAFLLRWLLVVHRRLALRRGKEKLAALRLARQASEGEAAEPAPGGDPSLELRLSEINAQAQRIIRIAIGVAALLLLSLIWKEILPALGYLNRITLWENGLAKPDETGVIPMVTLVDLLLGGTWMTLTMVACRNLPGLLDITVFQRLPIDAGARYAASALTQYLLVVLGAVICFRQIGIGWNSIQWLVAAMTVGLGFGLQEIFANFVSGIILLFERPVRVGDTVTIGNVSGTVTRIRIRATTVLDWDNKELIVPNRDFVTGNLVNWTLSNPNLRVVINVGIAYGADTRLATQLLHDIAAAHPLTLPDPEPVVVFNRFGNSSLDFELRVFASGLANSRMLRHELHLAIDDAFRAHQIEIAFPQQDLHIRSFPAALLGAGVDQRGRTSDVPAAVDGQIDMSVDDSSERNVA